MKEPWDENQEIQVQALCLALSTFLTFPGLSFLLFCFLFSSLLSVP